MKKDWRLHALHILECIAKIQAMQRYGAITEDPVLYDATLRNLQTLCESTQHLPQSLTNAYPSIPWSNIRGFRNILVHDYLGTVDPHTVMRIIGEHLPPLANAVQSMLDSSY